MILQNFCKHVKFAGILKNNYICITFFLWIRKNQQSDTVLGHPRRHWFFDRTLGATDNKMYTTTNRGPHQAFLKISGAGDHPRAAQDVFSLNPQISTVRYRYRTKVFFESRWAARGWPPAPEIFRKAWGGPLQVMVYVWLAAAPGVRSKNPCRLGCPNLYSGKQWWWKKRFILCALSTFTVPWVPFCVAGPDGDVVGLIQGTVEVQDSSVSPAEAAIYIASGLGSRTRNRNFVVTICTKKLAFTQNFVGGGECPFNPNLELGDKNKYWKVRNPFVNKRNSYRYQNSKHFFNNKLYFFSPTQMKKKGHIGICIITDADLNSWY